MRTQLKVPEALRSLHRYQMRYQMEACGQPDSIPHKGGGGARKETHPTDARKWVGTDRLARFTRPRLSGCPRFISKNDPRTKFSQSKQYLKQLTRTKHHDMKRFPTLC